MAVPFPHAEDFEVSDMGFNPELVEMFWKVAHILHTIVFEENEESAFPFFIEPRIHKSNNIERVRKGFQYNYIIKFKFRLSNDQEICGKISLILEIIPQTFLFYDSDDSETDNNRLDLQFEITRGQYARLYSNYEDFVRQDFKGYPGHEKLFLKLWLSSPLFIINPQKSGLERYAFSHVDTWHRIFVGKLNFAKKEIDEENNGQERVAGVMIGANKAHDNPFPLLGQLAHNPHVMYMIRQQMKNHLDEVMEELIRNRGKNLQDFYN